MFHMVFEVAGDKSRVDACVLSCGVSSIKCRPHPCVQGRTAAGVMARARQGRAGTGTGHGNAPLPWCYAYMGWPRKSGNRYLGGVCVGPARGHLVKYDLPQAKKWVKNFFCGGWASGPQASPPPPWVCFNFHSGGVGVPPPWTPSLDLPAPSAH